MKLKPIVLTTWWFDPIHSGHVEHFNFAKQYWELFVWLNSDDWLINKKGKNFMSRKERSYIIENLSSVDFVFGFDDNDWSACKAILKIYEFFGEERDIIFVKWGDRTKDNIPEVWICEDLGIEIIYDVWPSWKVQSSSELLKKRKEWIYN